MGLADFHQGGREYVTILQEDQWTPAPWANIIANEGIWFSGHGDGRRLYLVGPIAVRTG